MAAASNRSNEPTQTGYTLLGLLSFGSELSGYELKQWADNLRFFWSSPAMSQVYREVERLAAAGLVSQRRVVREGTRSTKVYRLTPAGEQAVRAWLATSPDRPVLRHPLALRVFFGHLLDQPDLRAAIEAHRAWCDEMLADLAAVRASLGDDERWRNVALVAEWGLDYYRGERRAVAGIAQAVDGTPGAPGLGACAGRVVESARMEAGAGHVVETARPEAAEPAG